MFDLPDTLREARSQFSACLIDHLFRFTHASDALALPQRHKLRSMLKY